MTRRKLRWDPAVRGSGVVAAMNGCRAFVKGRDWEVKPVGYEMLDPSRKIASGSEKNKTAAKAAAARVLRACRR